MNQLWYAHTTEYYSVEKKKRKGKWYQSIKSHGGILNLERLPTVGFNCVTFWKRQNYVDSKQMSG